MADIIDARTRELVWCGKVTDTVNGIGQSEKQANQAAKDLVKQFMKDNPEVFRSIDEKVRKELGLTREAGEAVTV